MPNYVRHRIFFENEQDMKKFVSLGLSRDCYGDSMYNFNNVIPLDPSSSADELWGTNKNGFFVEVNKAKKVVSFDTYWSSPDKVFGKIAKDNPDMKFHVYFADENPDFPPGKYFANGDGMLISEECEEDYEEAESLFNDIWDGDYESDTDIYEFAGE